MAWRETLLRMSGFGDKPVKDPAPGSQMRSWKHLTPQQLKGLRNLLFSARIVVEGAYSGLHRSPYKGASPEFVDYREYYPGDELRSIDWKAAARSDRLFIRLFEKHTDMNCYLMIDTSASMAYGGEPNAPFLDHRSLSKLDYALCLAASLAFVIVKQGDKAALTVFDHHIRHHVPPGGTMPHLYGMLSLMERLIATEQTSLARALRQAFPLCRRRGLLILISDLISDEDELFSALNLYRHRGFEIILFHVLHEHELTLPPLANVHFIDSESEESINAHPKDIETDYHARIQAWIDTLRNGSRGRRIDYHLAGTATPYETILQRYLLRRTQLGS